MLRLLLLLLLPLTSFAQLTNYRVFSGRSGNRLILRSWKEGSTSLYWGVDVQTLETSILTEARPISPGEKETWLAQTPYGKALRKEYQRDGSLQDAGIERADTTERGFHLTMDLCPSHKPLTRSLFEELIAAFGPEERPIPVTITITGLWMQAHADDLAWLKNLQTKGLLEITWVNHSFHHRYDPKLPLTANFLLEKGTDLNQEVLLNEQAMLQKGLLPSIFFRFPGLISDKAVFDRILDLGLLPLGSDAWLAKGEAPKQGSVVLIHPNGNEPLGIKKFIELVKQHSADIRHKNWLLYELPADVSKQN